MNGVWRRPEQVFVPPFWGGRAPVAEARAPQEAGRCAPRRVTAASIRRASALGAALLIATGLPALLDAAEPPLTLPSFARVAAAARAASIVVRAPGGQAAESECGDDRPDDECELADALAASRERTLGAGIIVDPSGIALTSARAVLRDPGFEVALVDGTPLNSTVMGLDRRTDVAVLRLEGPGATFPYLPLGDSERVTVGEWVVAVGAPLGFEGTVTAGVIVATPAPASRGPLAGFLQTDAAMSRGNAGGALVGLSGEIVGLGTGLFGDGVGYALPSRTVRRVYVELLEKRRVSRPWLGVATQSLTPDLARALGARDAAGVLIADVMPEGPGAGAGLRPGDIVAEVDGAPISSRAELERATSVLAPGRVVTLTVRRDGRTLTTAVRLAEEPDESKVPAALVQVRRLLGLEVRPIIPTMGVVATRIDPGSSAARAGLEPGDIIREVDRQPIGSVADFQAAVQALRRGARVLMLVQREDVALYVVMSAGE